MSQVPDYTPDLRLAVAFVNTLDWINDPPDGLTPEVAAGIARRCGFEVLAGGLASVDLERLRSLRDGVYLAFAAPDVDGKVNAVNGVLSTIDTRAVADARWGVVAEARTDEPIDVLAVLCASALAHTIASGGADRLGVCAAHPCQCGFVDLTRPGRQKFCCTQCNDRTAAAAYRDRRRTRTQ